MAGETLNTQVQHDYVVLARKYRSRTFAELIGQDALVRTLTNAIAMNKIHHAYVLTGIRGTGKTSTARLLAMALNCENGPSVTWDPNDLQVEAIRTGRHMDVFEYDAASNRSVEDVQRLFEGVNYAPVAGRFKVYIIDEVHMLSTTAFNALLKTLEEPPPQVKFIFATTDVQKIPLTVLSRCQRFDLKRIPSEVLAPYFEGILGKEQVSFEAPAVQMIARAADGSARDGLSLLDQAIALSVAEGSEQPKVTLATVEAMLGVADRARVFDLLETLVQGRVEDALAIVDDLYAGGSDAVGIVHGLMELVHLATRIKIVPTLKDGATLTEIERKRAVPLADKVPLPNLGRIYQLLMQAILEVKQAERPYEALAMACVRMAYLTPLPSMDKLLGEAQGTVEKMGQQGAQPVASLEAMGAMHDELARGDTRDLPVVEAGLSGAEREIKTAQVAEELQDWAAVVKLIRPKKPALAAALERQVHCMAFGDTRLELVIDKGLQVPADLLRDLRGTLRELTGVAWDIRQVEGDKENGVNLSQVHKDADAARMTAAAADPMVADMMQMFPGAELESVEDLNG